MWVPITETLFSDTLLAVEKSALDALKARPGSTAAEQLARQIEQVTNKVRGYCPLKVLRGPDGTIPDEVMTDALAMLRKVYFTGMPELRKLWTTAREEEYLQAIDLMKQWARGDFHVVAPESPAPVDEQPPGPSVEIIRMDDEGWGF